MKTLVAAAALAAVIVSPASAQTARRDQPPRVQAPQSYSTQYGVTSQRRNATQNDVYDISGRYIGRDPDPVIREDLDRDPPGNSGD
jgi:hypothetical protein